MHDVKCKICRTVFQTDTTAKYCSEACKRKSRNFIVRKSYNKYREQRLITRKLMEEKNPVHLQKRKEYQKNHYHHRSIYGGSVVCPKCGKKGYKYTQIATLIADSGKITTFSHVVTSHRHTENGTKTVLDKTCMIETLPSYVTELEEKKE